MNAICEVCGVRVSVAYHDYDLNKTRIPASHAADGGDHHWLLDPKSSDNLRKELREEGKWPSS